MTDTTPATIPPDGAAAGPVPLYAARAVAEVGAFARSAVAGGLTPREALALVEDAVAAGYQQLPDRQPGDPEVTLVVDPTATDMHAGEYVVAYQHGRKVWAGHADADSLAALVEVLMHVEPVRRWLPDDEGAPLVADPAGLAAPVRRDAADLATLRPWLHASYEEAARHGAGS